MKGTRTIENTLQPYDQAVEALDTAGNGSGLIAERRSRGRHARSRPGHDSEGERSGHRNSALNQALYKAVAAIDISEGRR